MSIHFTPDEIIKMRTFIKSLNNERCQPDCEPGFEFSDEPVSIKVSENDNQIICEVRFVETESTVIDEWAKDTFANIKQPYSCSIKQQDHTSIATIIFDLPAAENTEADNKVDNNISTNASANKVTAQNTNSNAAKAQQATVPVQINQVQSSPNTQQKAAFVQKQAKGPSTFQQVLANINQVLPRLTTAHADKLQDAAYCKKNAGLAYALLLPVDSSVDYKVQTRINNKQRYAKTPIAIGAQQYYVTNHLFKRDIVRIQTMLDTLISQV